VLSDARESTNRVKKGVTKELFLEIMVVLVRKGSYTTLNIVKDTKNLGKEKGKSEKPGQLLKKRQSEILVREKKFPSPQARRHVSATDYTILITFIMLAPSARTFSSASSDLELV